jgi:hypothetical protein
MHTSTTRVYLQGRVLASTRSVDRGPYDGGRTESHAPGPGGCPNIMRNQPIARHTIDSFVHVQDKPGTARCIWIYTADENGWVPHSTAVSSTGTDTDVRACLQFAPSASASILVCASTPACTSTPSTSSLPLCRVSVSACIHNIGC